MSSWETWFRTQNIDDVRKSLSLLDTQIKNETTQIHRNIGEQFPDIISLSERLESLQLLGNTLENHITNFGAPPTQINLSREAFTSAESNTSSIQTRNRKIGRILFSLAERSIAQKKYAVAARALYFLEAIGAKPTLESRSIADRLTEELQRWMVSGAYVSQTTYNACLIHLRKSPSQFLEAVLATRQSHIVDLLKSPSSIPDTFKAVDSALFIYNQVVSDWGNSRLSQRRIFDMAEFANLPLLPELINRNEGSDLSSHIRAYPPECYEQSELPGVDRFIEQICAHMKQTASTLLAAIPDAPQLISVMKDVVSHAENSLCSAEEGMTTLLDSFEPPFSERLLVLVKSVDDDTANLEQRTLSVSASIAQLSKLARNTKPFASNFSERLSELESKAYDQLKERTTAVYKEQRKSHLETEKSEDSGLNQAASLIMKLSELNDVYLRLGGQPDPIPENLYKGLAQKLIETIEGKYEKQREDQQRKDGQETREYWGDKPLMYMFELQLLMDQVLTDHDWNAAGLKSLREHLTEELSNNNAKPAENTSSETETDEFKMLLENRDASDNRSRLLVKPLVS